MIVYGYWFRKVVVPWERSRDDELFYCVYFMHKNYALIAFFLLHKKLRDDCVSFAHHDRDHKKTSGCLSIGRLLVEIKHPF